ncbi:ATP-dependent helicase [Alistipes sp. kh20]|uniref:UvrD-helicase domain-containing protein n=1 Tax=Alistipes montrealensis TaxID=2834113 RepID=UPI001BCCF96D|nr:ATP-dependent helicase [Alistipes montrealensis]MBS4765802.1 ATP-dependent helicase [Alistipes montrealensis]
MDTSGITLIKSRIEDKHKGDAKQLEVVFSPHKRLLVEAPAGYGKTHTMVSRIAYLIAIGQIPVPKRLLALTFSVNAAYKIKKDVSKNIPELLEGLNKQIRIKEKTYISNYHGFCRSVLKKYGHILHPALSHLDTLQSVDDSKSDAIMRSFKTISLDEANILSDFNSGVKTIHGRYLKENIDKYNSVVISELLPKKAIPFNAIITLTIKLFQECPNILTFYQNYYTSILVDEFQDTNLLSYWLLHFLVTEKTNLLFLGDSLQRIYGFIGAVPNLLSRAKEMFNLELITLDKNYRFASNENMLRLDRIIRQNALTPFKNPGALNSKIEFNIYEDQAKEALEVVIKSQAILHEHPSSNVAILAKQRGLNIEQIINTFNCNKIPFFYGLFSDEDPEYVKFNRKCLYEFIELLKMQTKVTKKCGQKHIEKIKELYVDNDSPTVKALFQLLDIFWSRVFVDYSFLSNEDKINLIKDTFEHNGIKQYMEFLDTKIIISTVHAAKGLEWDYVILPDMEKDSFPNYYGLCSKCKCGTDCNLIVNKEIENSFLEELSVFYVAVTRARKQVYFTASNTQLTKYGASEKNYSCFMKLPGIEF